MSWSRRCLPFLLLALAGVSVAPVARAQEESGSEEGGLVSVATSSGVVVHGVDRRSAAPRLRRIDEHLARDEAREAGQALATLLAGSLDGLQEEREGVYLSLREAALLRVASLPAEGLDAYREYVDPRARSAASAYVETRDLARLADDAYRMTLATPGPRLLVALADAELARGRLDRAARALEHLLRFWPQGELPVVGRAPVLSRLAALLATNGDVASLRDLRRGLGEDVAASPAARGGTVGDEIDRAIAAAERRSNSSSWADVPADGLRPVGELGWISDTAPGAAFRGLTRRLPTIGRELPIEPVALETADGPMLLIKRLTSSLPFQETRAPSLVALRPQDKPTVDGATPPLEVAWTWPSEERRRAGLVADDGFAFRAALIGDVVLFPWPSGPTRRVESGTFPSVTEVIRNDLVALSVRREGAEVDVRGREDLRRPDRDPELSRLSFVGRPHVVGRSVFATLVGRARGGEYTELHVARFDLQPEGARHRLLLRWRTHVLDGAPHPDASYDLPDMAEMNPELVSPGGLASRHGQLFVASQTGAVASLDADDGSVRWIETYERLGSDRYAIIQTRLGDWKHHDAIVDGRRVHVCPRDSEDLLSYAVSPFLDGRSVLAGRLVARGLGSARRPGTPLAPLLPDEVVTVADGVAFVSGRVEAAAPGTLALPSSPLVAYRLRDRDEGEPVARATPTQIPEPTSAGAPVRVGGHVLYPTFKGIYRVSVDEPGAPAIRLFEAPFPGRSSRVPDRVGNLVPLGGFLWSITPERVVLLAPAE